MTRLLRSSALFGAVMVLLTACGGVGTVSAADLQTQAAEQFASQFIVDSVDCPDDLTAEIGETVECTLESDGSSFVMEATVDSLDGDTVNLNFEITEEL